MTVQRLKILTFNHHESFLWALGKTGHDFDVVERYGQLDLGWNSAARPRPRNFTPVAFDARVRAKLMRGEYDLVVTHTIKNLLWLAPHFRSRFVFVAHIPLFFNSPLAALKSWFKKMVFLVFRATHRTRLVAVSEFKRRSWGVSGVTQVLTPAEVPGLKAGQGYDRIIIVCNNLAGRREELGLGMIQELAAELPIQIIGNNPGIDGSLRPEGFANFQELLTRARIYLYTIRQPWGDGYNTAMLEAMAMGMAVVTVANPSSPIQHGVNGLVGHHAGELKEHLRFLLDHPEVVDRLGSAAQKTIEQCFSMSTFVSGWERIFADVVAGDSL